jgi:putative oxidoreductase
MNSATLLLVGRILFALLFIVSGIRAATSYAGSASYLAGLGFPAPEAMNLIAIVVEIGGGISLIIGWQTRWAAWLLVAFVAVATGMAHRFWEFDAQQYGNQLNHMLKNLAVIGGLLYLSVLGPGRYSLEGRGQ